MVTVTGLQADEVYRMQVSAINIVGTGERSQNIDIQTLVNAVPDTPDKPQVVVLGDELRVRW